MKKYILLITLLSSLVFGATQQESLSLYAQVSAKSVALKWLRKGYSNESQFKVYRSVNGAKEKLIATVKPATYAWLKERGYDEDYIFFIYPFHDVKTSKERLEVMQSSSFRDSFRVMKLMGENQFAKNSGYFYRDEQVKKGVTYEYRVEEINQQGHLFSTRIKITGGVALKPLRVKWLQAFDEHTSIALNFDTATGFGFYNIYRKLPSQSAFKRLNKNPRFVSVVDDKTRVALYHDKKIAVGQNAEYYVTKVDMFGVEGSPSPHVTATRSVKKLTPKSVKGIHIVNSDKRIMLHWNKVIDAISYDVYRSKIYQEGFKKLNKKDITKNSFIDKSFNANTNYYYYIVAKNMHGVSKPSSKSLAYAKDATPPTRPTDLNYTIKGSEINLSWSASLDKKLLGYRIYMAMDRDAQEWSMLTKEAIKATHFTHQRAKTLSRHDYYYKITAVDKSFNESKASNIVKVKLLDVIAPEQPVISSYKVNNDRIRVEWNKVRVYDIASYNIYRKEGIKYVKLNVKALQTTQFIDESPKAGINEYVVTAVDSSKNESKRFKSTKIMAKDITPVKIEGLKVTQSKGAVTLSFDVNDSDYNGFEVMRSGGGDTRYYNISGFQKGKRFVDKQVSKKQHYFYTIKAYDKIGNIVESDVLEVKIKG